MKEKQLKRRVQEKIADPQCGDDLFLIGYADVPCDDGMGHYDVSDDKDGSRPSAC